GWDQPGDPKGDCRFDRKGDKLTVTVPAGAHELQRWGVDRWDIPHLLRDVEGDFVVQVRGQGGFRPGAGARQTRRRVGGLLVTTGKKDALVAWDAGLIVLPRKAAEESPPQSSYDFTAWIHRRGGSGAGWGAGKAAPLPLSRPVFLRLKRRGDAF